MRVPPTTADGATVAELLIEPIITKPEWVRETVEGPLLTTTIEQTEFELRVEHLGGPDLTGLRLERLCLRRAGDNKASVYTFEGPQRIGNLSVGQVATVGPFKRLFPTTGDYVISCSARADNVEDDRIQTRQRLLEGGTGRGWSSPESTHGWQNPIVAIDYASLTQVGLNRSIMTLTQRIFVLTIVVVVLGVLTLFSSCVATLASLAQVVATR